MAAETAALERSSLQEEKTRFVAEVHAMQLASLTVHSNRAADLTEQVLEAQTPHNNDAASHGPMTCSRASRAAVGKRTCSHQQHIDASRDTAHSSAICDSAAQHALGVQTSEQHSRSAPESQHGCDSLASQRTDSHCGLHVAWRAQHAAGTAVEQLRMEHPQLHHGCPSFLAWQTSHIGYHPEAGTSRHR